MPLASTLRRLAGCLFFGLPFSLLAQTLPATPEPTALHCSMLPLSATQRVANASLIVEGEVLDARSFWDASHQHIYTAHRVRVFRLFKGDAAAEITVLTEGGTVDLELQQLTNTLTLVPGQQGVLFLYPAPFAGLPTAGPTWTAYGSQQGFIQYDLTTATATEPFRSYAQVGADFYQTIVALTGQVPRLVQANAALAAAQIRQSAAARGEAPVIASLAPLTITAGTESVLTITGTGFGAARGTTGFVEFKNADDGGATYTKPLDTDYVAWSDTRIQVRVPSYSADAHPAGSGSVRVTSAGSLTTTSGAVLTVLYALSNVQETTSKLTYRPGHVTQNNTGGYTFRFDPSFASNTAAAQAWQRALTSWRCQTGMNWELGATRTKAGAADDGENAVGFDQSGSIDPNQVLPAQVLGRTTNRYSGCRRADGVVVFYVREVDMQFSSSANWQYGPAAPVSPQLDFETVAVHELGHAQQLTHLILPAAVMHYAVARGQVSRQLNPLSDVAGGRLVLKSRSFLNLGCGPASMLPAPLTTVTAVGTDVVWTTRDECFLREFVLERATTDTTTWQTLATVAAGASGTTYQYRDTQAPAGLHYYRLRLRRPDNSLDTTAPIAVTTDAEAISGLLLYPNPVTDPALHLQYTGTAASVLRVYVYDAVGRIHRATTFNTRTGLNLLTLNIEALQPGWYVVRWEEETGRKGTSRFVRLLQ